MKRTNHRQQFVLSFLLVLTLFGQALPPARAQDVITSSDFSSAFVFKTSGKPTPRKVAFQATRNVQRTRAQRAETTRQIIRQSVTVARVAPKRVRSKEVDPNSKAYKDIQLNRKSPEETAVIFSGVGEYYLNQDNVEEALRFFRQATELDVKNLNAKTGLSEALTRQGDKLLNDEKYDLAKLPYAEALVNNPKNGAAFAGLAEIASAKNDAAAAITNYEKALGFDKDLTQLNAPLGVLYFQQGEIEKSEAALQKAIAANPDNAETQFFFGLVRYKQNRDEEALKAFQRSIQLDPTNAEVHYFLGEVYDRQNKPAESIAEYRRAVELNPKYAEAWYDLGVAYNARANAQNSDAALYEEAIKAYKEVIRLKPTDGQSYANLGDIYRQLDRLDEAISAYRLATTFIKDNAELYSNFGFVAARRAMNPVYRTFWKTSFENFEKAVALNVASSNYIDYQNLGWAYRNAARGDLPDQNLFRDKMQKARDAFQKALALDPPAKIAAAINLNLGMTLTDLGDYQGAMAALKKATEQQPNWLVAINELGLAYRKLNDFDNAARQFRLALAIDGNYAPGYYNLAETEFRRGDVKEAKKNYEKLKSMRQLGLVQELEKVTNGAIRN